MTVRFHLLFAVLFAAASPAPAHGATLPKARMFTGRALPL